MPVVNEKFQKTDTPFVSIQVTGQTVPFVYKKELPSTLHEISGTAKDGDALWAISNTRNAGANIFKLDLQGNVIQVVPVKKYRTYDVEAVAVDEDYLYVGDVGDNKGVRGKRCIIRILKSLLVSNRISP